MQKQHKGTVSRALMAATLAASTLFTALPATTMADEPCNSPYMAKIVGQEDFVYVWTLGIEGLGDGQDKLVTIDVNPKSKNYGKVINTLSVGGRNEAHHSGLTDDRRYLWAGGLDTNKLFIFDVHTDPAKPTLHKVVTDFVAKSGGVVGPHTTYALPGRMIITGLSNNQDHGGRTALVEYTNEGEYVATYWVPTDENLQGAEKSGKYADGYNYDVSRAAAPQRDGDFIVHRLVELHDGLRQDAAGQGGHEAFRQHGRDLGSAHPQAEEGARCPGCAARGSLCLALRQ